MTDETPEPEFDVRSTLTHKHPVTTNSMIAVSPVGSTRKIPAADSQALARANET